MLAMSKAARQWMVDETFVLPFEHSAFDDYFDMASPAMKDIVGNRFPEFVSDVMIDASLRTFEATTQDGEDAVIYANLFLVPLAGPLDEIEALVKDGASLSRLARSFRLHGLFHASSSSSILPFAIHPSTLVGAGPGMLRKLVSHMGGKLFPMLSGELDSGEYARKVRSILDIEEEIPELAETKAPTSQLAVRALLGVRSMVCHVDEEDDFEGDILAPLGEEASNEKGMKSWYADISRWLAEKGLDVQLAGDWNGITATMASMRLSSALDTMALQQGVDPDVDPDRVHIVIDEDAVHVMLQFGDVFVGPVDAPMLMAARDMESFQDDLATMGGEIVVHPDLRSLMALHGAMS
jgi:hypothetical protein